LLAARELYKAELYGLSLYHLQKCAEKTLKAVLILLGKEMYEHRVAPIFRDEVATNYDYLYLEEIAEKSVLVRATLVEN